MILARVVGTVVATRKDPRLEGKKLLILKPIAPDGAVSRISFLYSSAAQIASGVSISRVLPSADSVSCPWPSRIWVNSGRLAFFRPRPTKP